MRVLYFDCFAGISGDMTVGALIGLGVDPESLKQQLAALGLGGYEIVVSRVERGGIAAVKFDVKVDLANQPARTLADIRRIITGAALQDRVKRRSIEIFERLGAAEACVHGTTIDSIHFHEVGAVDSILDIVGAAISLEMLGVERFVSSPLRVGRGSVQTEHGLLPVPAPATAELLRAIPVYGGELEGEFVTPTGAAIVATLCESFGPVPPVSIDRIGYGAGGRDPKGFPNALRLVLGEAREESHAHPAETVLVVETNIDDMNPQAYGFVMDRAFALGALDCFITPVQMKKGRPAVLLTVLCERAKLDLIADLLLAETTTLGVRYYEASRRVLDRAFEVVETEYGSVRVKVARDGARTLHFQPEYDDCARLAEEARVPLLEVQMSASAAYRRKIKPAVRTNKADGELEEKQ